MAEGGEFKPLKECGNIALSEESEIKVYVDEYKGYKYASVRTFLKRKGYSGPTKAGVTMNPKLLDSVLPILEKLPKEPETIQDQELARFPKKAGLEFVVRVTIYKDTTGVDLREWVNDGTYEGWSKKGVRIPYAELPKAVAYLKDARAFLG